MMESETADILETFGVFDPPLLLSFSLSSSELSASLIAHRMNGECPDFALSITYLKTLASVLHEYEV